MLAISGQFPSQLTSQNDFLGIFPALFGTAKIAAVLYGSGGRIPDYRLFLARLDPNPDTFKLFG